MAGSILDSFQLSKISIFDIKTLIYDFESDFSRLGPLSVLDHLSAVHTTLQNSEVDYKLCERVTKLLVSCLIFHDFIGLEDESLALKDLISDEAFDIDEKNRHRDCIKSVCGILCSGLKLKLISTQKTGNIKYRGKTKQSAADKTALNLQGQYLVYCERFLEALSALFSLKIQYLWSPSILEEEFLRLIIDFCFKLLEDSNISKIKSIFKSIGRLIGLVISRHNALMDIALKILAIAQHIEGQAQAMSNLTNIIVSEHNYGGLIVQLFKELAHSNKIDTFSDSACSRNSALFLSGLGRALPKEVLNNASLLMCHLEWDPYSMRNAVLDCFGQIVRQVFSTDILDDVSKKSRDCFLNKLQDHIYDIHAYVRSHVLQIWIELVTARVIPLSRFNHLTELVIGRLKDKSCNVRKNASSLIYHLLCNNPYSHNLNPLELEQKLILTQKENEGTVTDEASEIIKTASKQWEESEQNLKPLLDDVDSNPESQSIELLDSNIRAKIIDAILNFNYSEAIDIARNNLESNISLSLGFFKVLFFAHVSQRLVTIQKDSQCSDDEENQKRVTLNYLKDALNFSKMVCGAIPTVCRLLHSDTTTDVIEILQLLVTLCKIRLADSFEIVDRILPLVWSTEASLKAATLEALWTILSEDQHANLFVNNTISILNNAKIATFSAIEEFIICLSEKGMLPKTLTKELWKIFTEDQDRNKRVNAMYILGFASQAKTDIIGQNLELMASKGLGTNSDIPIAIATCNAILSYSKALRKNFDNVHGFRLDYAHLLFKRLIEFILKNFEVESNLWCPFFEFAIKLIVSLSDKPFFQLSNILKELIDIIRKRSKISELILTRFIYAISHIAVQLMVLLEGDFLTELKRRAQVIRSLSASKSRKSVLNSSQSRSSALPENPEYDINVPGADDIESEFVKDLCEQEILHSDNITSIIVPLLLNILNSASSYSSALNSAAALALSKLMLISSKFCSENLQLLLSSMKKSPHSCLRLNAVVIVGDISQRFPNLIEPWMPHVFSTLEDSSVEVRRTVVSVLSSLILNDMVKVKGHVSELALCVEDEDRTILSRTRLFFTELSRKDNAIYNILPEVLSRLSEAREKMDRTLFERVMKFLLKFLQKERQCESFVDKLCYRLIAANHPGATHDIAFCLSQLTLGDRAFKKLVDNFAAFKDKLYDNDLYNSLQNLIAKVKRGSGESKAIVEEFESMIEQARNRGVEVKLEVGIVRKSPSPDPSPAKKVPRVSLILNTPLTKSLSKKRPISTRKRTRTVKKLLSFNNDSDSDSNPLKV